MMKKFTPVLTLVLLMALPLVFASCEEDDDDIAFNMDGVWYGQIAADYFTYRYGNVTEYSDVMFEFTHSARNYATGSGREVDFDAYGRVSDVAWFDYEVVNGIIYLYYSDGSDIAIHSYSLFSNEFRGQFHDAHTGQYLASFSLERDYQGWDHRYYYAKKGQFVEDWEQPSDSLKQ